MGKINLTNRQARLIAESIFADIKKAEDDKLQKRKDKELKQFLTSIKKDPVFVKLVKAEEELEKAVVHSKTINDAYEVLNKRFSAGDKLSTYSSYIWGTNLSTDKNIKLSQKYLDKKIELEFKVNYGVTVDELESKVILSVVGKENLDSLIDSIKAEYIK